MLNFLQNLLPRLKQLSQSLDQIQLFVDKPWVLIDEDKQQQTYIFRRNGELIMSLDGQVRMGAWEYIAPAQSLLIDRGVDKLLLNHLFFTDALLVLARDGRPESRFVLANRQLIPDLNIEKYLQDLNAKEIIKSNIQSKSALGRQLYQNDVKFTDGTMATFFSVKANGVAVGDAGYTNGVLVSDGRYITQDKWGVITKEGLVTEVFWPQRYKAGTGDYVFIDCQRDGANPKKLDRIFWLSGLPVENGRQTIINVGKVWIQDGSIDSLLLF